MEGAEAQPWGDLIDYPTDELYALVPSATDVILESLSLEKIVVT